MTARNISKKTSDMTRAGGIELYFKRIFALMFGSVALTAVAAYMTIWGGGLQYLINFQTGGLNGLYYVLLFGALGLSLWAQFRAFSIKPSTGALLLALYAVLIGVTMTPLIAIALSVNPGSILMAFIIAALMFGCMALFGYKTVKNLSFLGVFLMVGMIGLILIGIISIFWPALMGGTFGTIVCIAGILMPVELKPERFMKNS